MKPAPFKYFAPTTIDETLSLLAEHGFDAKLLAGGQSLVPTMNFRLAQPEVLIDINRVKDLFFVDAQNSELRIGAMTRHAELERSDIIAKHLHLITETMPFVAHPQIRNRGTLGGSLAHADPAAELPAVMMALNARFQIQSKKEKRWINAKDFFVDLFTVDLEAEELLTGIVIPTLPKRSGWAFKEVARRHGDFALAGVAAVVTVDENDTCQDARIVLLSVGNGPVAATLAQKSLIGEKPSLELIKTTAEITAGKDIEPGADMHASVAYRRRLAQVLTRQALQQAFERAKA